MGGIPAWVGRNFCCSPDATLRPSTSSILVSTFGVGFPHRLLLGPKPQCIRCDAFHDVFFLWRSSSHRIVRRQRLVSVPRADPRGKRDLCIARRIAKFNPLSDLAQYLGHGLHHITISPSVCFRISGSQGRVSAALCTRWYPEQALNVLIGSGGRTV